MLPDSDIMSFAATCTTAYKYCLDYFCLDWFIHLLGSDYVVI